jgi:hypothetical protein
MKSLILSVAITLLHIGSIYSQSQLELEVVKQLNIYRKKHNLGSVKYDSELSKVAEYHTKYIIECHKVNHAVHYEKNPHNEQFDLKNFKELSFEQRTLISPDRNMWGEIQMESASYLKNASIESIAKGIIASFAGSPKHNDIMLADDAGGGGKHIVGLSIIKIDEPYGDYSIYSINIDFGVIVGQKNP